MVFSSLTFLYFFLPLSLLFHYSSRNDLYRNIFLTIFSLVFYAWAEPMWIFLMVFTALANYGAGIYIERHAATKKAKAGMVAAVVLNLTLLVSFKYGGLFMTTSIIGYPFLFLALPIPFP